MSKVFLLRNHAHSVQVAEYFLNLVVDRPMKVTIDDWEQTRSLEQNSKLHAMLGDIAKQKEWDGEYLTIDQWKRLMVCAWMRATDRPIKLVRAIDGTGFDPIFQRTSRLSVKETIELIDYLTAWAVGEGIMFYDDLSQVAV